jgi:hypothetical protein
MPQAIHTIDDDRTSFPLSKANPCFREHPRHSRGAYPAAWAQAVKTARKNFSARQREPLPLHLNRAMKQNRPGEFA